MRHQDFDRGFEISEQDDALAVELQYPRIEGHVRFVEVELMDVRAADSIRITFDFERDGWSILQASRFSSPEGSPVSTFDPDWQEVAFRASVGQRQGG